MFGVCFVCLVLVFDLGWLVFCCFDLLVVITRFAYVIVLIMLLDFICCCNCCLFDLIVCVWFCWLLWFCCRFDLLFMDLVIGCCLLFCWSFLDVNTLCFWLDDFNCCRMFVMWLAWLGVLIDRSDSCSLFYLFYLFVLICTSWLFVF